MQAQFPFLPRGLNQNPPVAQDNFVTTAAAVTANLTNTAPGGGNEMETTVRIVNQGNDPTAFAFGAAPGLTLGNGEFMLGNTVETFTLPAKVSQITVIGSAGGSTLRVHAGDGM